MQDGFFEQFMKLSYPGEDEQEHFPPTLIYNEGWLLCMLLHWFAVSRVEGHALSFLPQSTWYSEGLLPSPFRARHRGDPQAESRTHADGVIGHIRIDSATRSGMVLLPGARQLVLLEAKLSASLSAGVRNAPAFGQAARSVACMAELLRIAQVSPADMNALAFYVLAPAERIEQGIFTNPMQPATLLSQVEKRIAAYRGEKDAWFSENFLLLMQYIRLDILAWEDIIRVILEADDLYGRKLLSFYELALRHNTKGNSMISPNEFISR